MAAAPMSPAPALEVHDAQGLLASGYGHLPHACYLIAQITDAAAARAWLGASADTVTTAAGRSDGPAMNIALTSHGLAELGLGADVLAGFSLQFREGMTTGHRQRVLGDIDASAPRYWAWGGPETPVVDMLVALYAADRPALDAIVERTDAALLTSGVNVTERLGSVPAEHEHFGFRDGIAQPAIEGLRSGRPDNTVKAGEFLFGYPNEYGLYTARPLVAATADPAGVLPDDAERSGRRDLGRNGSHLVFRQLAQDVPAFWSFVDGASTNGGGDRLALAAKMVGRWPGGAPLVLSPQRDEPRYADADDFGYHEHDPDGLRCPLGAHVRRAHPRDSLDPDPGSERSIAIDKHHRLLRRGRAYGTPMTAQAALRAAASNATNGSASPEDERGLHFICLCTNLARQFEFVQHTWCNNPKFNGLYDDRDPLIGPADRTFTVQALPTRRRIGGLPAFVQVRGGAYFFLPGIRALRYLAELAPQAHV